MYTRAFWKSTGERIVRGAIGGVGFVVGGELFNALTVSWEKVGGFALGGAVLALVGSVGAAPFGVKGSPAITPDPAQSPSSGTSVR